MEVQFEQDTLRYLCSKAWGIKTLEETGEIRLAEQEKASDEILGAWGQPILLEKEWSSGSVSVSGGVNVWVLLRGQDGGVQCVDGWIPFRQTWELHDSKRDGALNAQCALEAIDARMTGAGKLIVTVRLRAELRALEPCAVQQYKPGHLPEDIYTLQQTELMCLPVEAGEKRTSLTENVNFSPANSGFARVLFYRMHPEVYERRIMGDKLVFRGAVKLRLVYMEQDGQIAALDEEFPISQYVQLDGEYASEAFAHILPVVTAAEAGRDDEGKLVVHCDTLWQYEILDRVPVSFVQDAYSNARSLDLTFCQLSLPNAGTWKEETCTIERELPFITSHIVDCDLMVYTSVDEKSGKLQTSGSVRILYYDENDVLKSGIIPVSSEEQLPQLDSVSAHCIQRQAPSVDCKMGGGRCTAYMTVPYALCSTEEIVIKWCTAIHAEDEQHKRDDRPSVILRRVDEHQLWCLAKACGSSEKAIRQANEIAGELLSGKMLLIPVE